MRAWQLILLASEDKQEPSQVLRWRRPSGDRTHFPINASRTHAALGRQGKRNTKRIARRGACTISVVSGRRRLKRGRLECSTVTRILIQSAVADRCQLAATNRRGASLAAAARVCHRVGRCASSWSVIVKRCSGRERAACRK